MMGSDAALRAMTMQDQEIKQAEQNLLAGVEVIESDRDLIVAINQAIGKEKHNYTSGREYKEVPRLRNHLKMLQVMVGEEIFEKQYPEHSTSVSMRQLLLKTAPLNILAKGWRKPYILKESEEHCSLGRDDYHDEPSHNSVRAMNEFEMLMQANGGYFGRTIEKLTAIDILVTKIMQLKPRTRYDFDRKDAKSSTGLAEVCEDLDGMIDGVLAEYSENVHPAQSEGMRRDLYKHLCKNAALHFEINTGKFRVKENQAALDAVACYSKWKQGHDTDIMPPLCEEDLDIALCMSAIFAIDRGGEKSLLKLFETGIIGKYVRQAADFVRYARHIRFAHQEKPEKKSQLSYRLVKRGDTNKEIVVIKQLVKIKELIYADSIFDILIKTDKMMREKILNQEFLKYVASVFGALSWATEHVGWFDYQVDGYFESRKMNWEYRNKLWHKLLRLDFDQLMNFTSQIIPALKFELHVIKLKIMRMNNEFISLL